MIKIGRRKEQGEHWVIAGDGDNFAGYAAPDKSDKPRKIVLTNPSLQYSRAAEGDHETGRLIVKLVRLSRARRFDDRHRDAKRSGNRFMMAPFIT